MKENARILHYNFYQSYSDLPFESNVQVFFNPIFSRVIMIKKYHQEYVRMHERQ